MKRNLLSLIITTLFISTVSFAAELINPFTVEGNWYKANLHTHTTTSDGDVNLPTRVKQYRDIGYNVLVVTDHEKTNNVDGYSDANFLLISGMETHPSSGADVPYHLVCINIPQSLSFAKDVNATERIRRVKASGGEIIFAHPYWSGHTTKEMLAVDGYIAMEVYNGGFSYTGKGYNSVQWDQLSNTGKIIPAVAADDVHRSDKVGQSWIMLKAKQLTANAVMDALRAGCYYSSCGPAFEDFRIEGDSAIVKCSPVMEICFMGQNTCSRNFTAQKNSPITSAVYKLPKKFKWVRAEIVDADGKHAWSNPIIIPQKKDQ
ncbi:MAG: PHP domain protein [Planctomycetes bacterium ADurb.Bin401]|nr:MAG: PHP domain protein [Planctomycetes bacterium ADurb.Bin401]